MDYFHYKGFEPTSTLRLRANRTAEKILNAAPSDAKLSAMLDWDGERYHCSLEIGSQTWPAAVSTVAHFPAIALDKAEFAMFKKLAKWNEFRFTPAVEQGELLRSAS